MHSLPSVADIGQKQRFDSNQIINHDHHGTVPLPQQFAHLMTQLLRILLSILFNRTVQEVTLLPLDDNYCYSSLIS
jgi:hypothetical protein